MFSYEWLKNELTNQQNSLATNFIENSKLKEKYYSESKMIENETEAVIMGKKTEQEFIKNLSITQSKIKDLEAEGLLLKSLIEPDIKLRIEKLKTEHNIRNIIAYVFFGRREFTKILFRYLDSNLKENGGILDKIVLIEHLLGLEKCKIKII